MHRFFQILSVGLLLGVVRAEALTWQTVWRTVVAENGQTMVALGFPFKNTGSQSVRIVSLVPSCDCLSPKLDKQTFAPGESGELNVEFSVGGRAGRQEKTITVTTDAVADSATVLKLIVDIPEPVGISPRFVYWRTGETDKEKVLEVTLAEPNRDAVGEVKCAEPAFDVRLEPGTESGRHRVFIRPIDTSKPVQAPIRLTAVVNSVGAQIAQGGGLQD